MQANIGKRGYGIVFLPDNENRLIDDIDGYVVPRLWNLGGTPDANPATVKQVLCFAFQNIGMVVYLRRQALRRAEVSCRIFRNDSQQFVSRLPHQSSLLWHIDACTPGYRQILPSRMRREAPIHRLAPLDAKDQNSTTNRETE